MSHTESPATAARASVSTAEDPSPELGSQATDGGDFGHQGWCPSDPQPDSRSPYEVVHSQAYLIRCLVRQYGWHVIAPDQLYRPRKFMRPGFPTLPPGSQNPDAPF